MPSSLTYDYSLILFSELRNGAYKDKITIMPSASTGTIEIEGEQISFKISLSSLDLKKKIYEPNLIEARIAYSSESQKETDIKTLRKIFLNKQAELRIDIKDEDTSKAQITEKGYYVYEICPVYKKVAEATSIEIKLSIFSLDKLLTLDKYSQAYLGRKLKKELLNSVDRFKLRCYSSNKEEENEKIEVAVSPADEGIYLQHLAYDNQTESENQSEFIQPYLVQYNESFYDFLVRVANRCGEFLYFENGKFTIGLPVNPTVKVSDMNVSDFDNEKKAVRSSSLTIDKIDEYDSVSFMSMSSGSLDVHDYSRDSLKDKIKEFGKASTDNHSKSGRATAGHQYYQNSGEEEDYTVPDDANFISNTSKKKNDNPYNYNLEIATDEFFMPLYKDGFGGTHWKELSMGSNEKHYAHAAANFLASTSLYDFITEGIIEYFELAYQFLRYKKFYGERGQDRFIKPFAYTNISNINSSSSNKTPDVVVPFSENELNRWTTREYYSDIRRYEESQQKQMIEIDMGNNLKNFRLGNFIKVSGSDEIYVVTEVSISLSSIEKKQSLKAIPLLIVNEGEDPHVIAFPPVSGQKVFRKSGPQTAFVVDNSDPKRQGRVRIRYPWQSNEETIKPDNLKADGTADEVITKYNKMRNEAASPWIRMATPAASPDSGIYFEAEPGDEVLVNYENGNIERPCVVGALYSKNALAPAEKGKRVIVSKYGHMIRFKDPYDGVGEYVDSTGLARVLSSISPLFEAATFLIPEITPTFTNNDINKMTGGIDIGDAFGIYKISMSSDERAIKILSPFGDVTLGAFTGINISAPNGNIKISGKNIDISASNKLNITAGSNIKNKQWLYGGIESRQDFKDKAIETLLGQLKRFSPLDLGLLRTFLEVFIRPIDGTLSLKTYGFMKLEAGEGEAQVPRNNYTQWYLSNKSQEKGDFKKIDNVFSIIGSVIDKIREIVDSHKGEVAKQLTTLGPQIGSFLNKYVNNNNNIKIINTSAKLVNLLYDNNLKEFKESDIDCGDLFNNRHNGQNLNGINKWNKIRKKIYIKQLNIDFSKLWYLFNDSNNGFKDIIQADRLQKKIGKAFEWRNGKEVATELKNIIQNSFNNNEQLFLITKSLTTPNNALALLDINQQDYNNYRQWSVWNEKATYLKRHIFVEFLKKFNTLFPDFTLNFDTSIDVSNDDQWNNQKDILSIQLKTKDAGAAFLDKAITWFTEDFNTGIMQNIWKDGSGVKGKILISEKANKTIRISGNHDSFENGENTTERTEQIKLTTAALSADLRDKLKSSADNNVAPAAQQEDRPESNMIADEPQIDWDALMI